MAAQSSGRAEGQPLAYALVGSFYVGSFRIYMSLFWFAAAAILLGYVLTQTKVGNWIQASGGNPNAARARGVNVSRTKVSLFMLSSVLASFAGIISSIRISAANPNSGDGYELEVIAMVVIGGTVLTGGRGSILGTVLSCLIIGVLNNGLFLLNVSPFWQQVIMGGVILLAVAIDRMNGRERNLP